MPFIFDDIKAELVANIQEYDLNRYAIVRKIFIRIHENWSDFSKVCTFRVFIYLSLSFNKNENKK